MTVARPVKINKVLRDLNDLVKKTTKQTRGLSMD